MTQQGFYPDPPSRRMAYDEDGTIVITSAGSGALAETLVEVTTANKRLWNNETWATTVSVGNGASLTPYYIMIFPELRDVTHVYRNLMSDTFRTSNSLITFEGSIDTTTGLDGTWTAIGTYTAVNTNTMPNYRTQIGVLGANGIKAIRYRSNPTGQIEVTEWAQWHLYGHKSAGQSPHRIDFVDVGGNNLAIDFDYGDQPRNTARIWQPSDTYNQGSGLYLRNRSTTKQAQSVSVTHEALTSDIATYMSLSKDNVTYGSSVSYTTINPLQTVGPIYVRHNPTNVATLGLKAARLQVTVGTWL
jgi:hypothetical protein